MLIKSGATGTFTFNGTGNFTGAVTITAGPSGASKAAQVTLQPPAVSSVILNSKDIVAGSFNLGSAKLECPSSIAVQISGDNDTAATVTGSVPGLVENAGATFRARQHAHYSMISSARARTNGGIVTPMARAVFRLMTSSNAVGRSIGIVAGLAPFRMRST
jgi:hypothetical protein